MDKISDFLKDFYKHFAGLGIYIIPGIVALETVFNVGYFGNKIITIYDLIFFIFWSLILGLPYHFGHPKAYSDLVKKLKRQSPNKDPEFLNNLSDEAELGFIICKICVFYFIFKLITCQTFLSFEPILSINESVANYFIATIITMLLGIVIIIPYKWYIQKMYIE